MTEVDIKTSLVDALEGRGEGEKTALDELVRETLVAGLEMEREVQDAKPSVEGAKRPRGRPRKDARMVNGEVCRAEDPSKCWKHGYSRKVVLEERKAKARRQAKLNPQPTRDMQAVEDLRHDIEEIGWDIKDAPDSKGETRNMLDDLDNLRREAGMKKLDDGFEPYAAYRRKWAEYTETKEKAVALHEQAKLFLDREELDEVEQMKGSLKRKPKEIETKYNEVLKAYNELCDALCEEIDRRGTERGLKDKTASESERSGNGMMHRETSRDYQKRMRKLGRTKEIPETIKKVDEIVEQTERRWRSVAGMGMAEFGKVKENFRKTMDNLMKRCSLATNRGVEGLNGVLESWLKSQHDFVKKGEQFDNGKYVQDAIIGGEMDGPRYVFSRKCFGVDKGLKPSKYEKYGCLHTLPPREGDNLMGGQYGKNVIRWKRHKTVATMTFTDSLCLARDGLNYVTPCLVTSPSPCCFNPENKDIIDRLREGPINIGLDSLCYQMGTEYCELQLHGENQYDAEAIESISFGSEYDVANLSKAARQAILENHIPLYLKDQPIEMDQRGRVKRKKGAEEE